MDAKTYDQVLQAVSLVLIICAVLIVLAGLLRLALDQPGYYVVFAVFFLGAGFAARQALK